MKLVSCISENLSKDLMHGPSAIDQKGLPCDEVAFIRCEKDDCPEKIVGLLYSLQRCFADIEKGALMVIPIEEGNIIFFTDLIHDREKPLSPPAQAFTKMVEELKRTLILSSAITTHGSSVHPFGRARPRL